MQATNDLLVLASYEPHFLSAAADGRWRPGAAVRREGQMDGGDPARRVCSASQGEGLTKGYNDVIDTLINASLNQR